MYWGINKKVAKALHEAGEVNVYITGGNTSLPCALRKTQSFADALEGIRPTGYCVAAPGNLNEEKNRTYALKLSDLLEKAGHKFCNHELHVIDKARIGTK